jgi:hypothetical protein
MPRMIDEMLGRMAEAPDGQICKTIVDDFTKLIGEDLETIVDGLKEIRGQSVQCALMSGFAMRIVDNLIDITEEEIANGKHPPFVH